MESKEARILLLAPGSCKSPLNNRSFGKVSRSDEIGSRPSYIMHYYITDGNRRGDALLPDLLHHGEDGILGDLRNGLHGKAPMGTVLRLDRGSDGTPWIQHLLSGVSLAPWACVAFHRYDIPIFHLDAYLASQWAAYAGQLSLRHTSTSIPISSLY